MRLWHKDLIPLLPKQQLLGQWRECCLIAKNIAENGTPNHILVNKVINYPITHLWKYGYNIMLEMIHRGYKCDFNRFDKWFNEIDDLIAPNNIELFKEWHNDRYYVQCYYNLEEKYDCGGISYEEWNNILMNAKFF